MQPLLETSAQTCNAWRSLRDNFKKAEEALSEVITDDVKDHNAFASRALVRARALKWNAALEDAQMSINIQPSVLGYVALGIAHSGQRNGEGAIQALDLGFIDCNGDINTIRFLLLVKSIIIFNIGRGNEGIARITDLIKARPGNDTPLCHNIQTYMYAQLGMAAMKAHEYDRAVQQLTSAISLGPFDMNSPGLETISLVFGWKFDILWRDIHERKCEALYAARRTNEAVESLHAMMDQLDEGTKAMMETKDWLVDFKHRCTQTSKTLGDEALRVNKYSEAVNQYSAALALDPSEADIFIKRSEARAAMGEWKDALEDAEHAIELDHSSPWGYEWKHVALHGAQDYGNAIEAFSAMLLKLENSPDPVTRKLRQQYLSPVDVDRAVQRAINQSFQNFPLRLVDTTTGHLYDRDERINAFKATPDFKELISSMTTDTTFDHARISEVIKKYFRYAMLSHRWEGTEPLLCDVRGKSVYDLEAVYPATKLQRFCQTARDAGYNWAWSDTCCIDKTNSVELQESLTSMFVWYRCSSLTVIYLSDVPPSSKPGALAKSAWTTRGWTLQEFLAPRVIRFFAEDWTPYLNDRSPNHGESITIMQELEDATGVAGHALTGFRPGTTEVRQRLRWASTRITTMQEDVAYSLFGIFHVTLVVDYGEKKQNALGRLLEAIVSRSGDVTALDWVGQSSKYNSCLPANITAYEAPAYAPSFVSREEMGAAVSGLQSSITAEMALALYNKLNGQPPPRFANHRLTLPCIVFPLTALTIRADGHSGIKVYYATADGLEDVQITTADRLSRFSPSRPALPGREMLLVRPWNRDLLGAAEIASDIRNAVAARPPSNVIPPAPSSQPTRESDTLTQAWTLVARLKQRFAALLLVRQPGGAYQRVASDHNIIAQVRDVGKLADIKSIEVL
ncbi:hypothetical protein BJ138DRAFT_1104700 [Hygrophoropsis aurantiaca]|uniref:Uncharacterized protein n=1 Tax=Hygrophoropsis aurantiaca TaxID=72124 RepID=A0ACB8A2X4_9AGAM|nr:hypothetical protein BJ138DRAFT_1104700 [Hygrophoropsis aurantiaca]